MVPLSRALIWVTLVVVSGGFAGIATYTYRRKTFPGRTSFTAFCLLLALMVLGVGGVSAVLFLKSLPGTTNRAITLSVAEDVVQVLTFAAGLLAPLAWLRFVIVYTGQRIPTDRRTLLLVGSPVILTLGSLVVFIGFTFLPFVYDVRTLPSILVVAVVRGVNYLLRVTGFYLAALLVAGASLVAWTSYTFRHLSTRGGTLLAVGCVLPWAAAAIPFIARLFDQPLLVTAHAAAGGVLGLAAVGAAVVGDDVFETVPAAGTVGRDVTVETMNDPVVVVDRAHRIVDLNPAAERLFSASVDTLGAPLGQLVEGSVDPERLLGEDRWEFALADGQRVIEARGSALEDEYGRALGHSLVFHDITDRKRRQQRIQVLNRVLRHNLRNDMAVVNGHAEALAAMPADLKGHPEQIQQTAAGLLGIGEKAREIELVVATQQAETTPLAEVIERAVTEVQETYPDCRFQRGEVSAEIEVNGTVMEAVVTELLENGAKHNDADNPVIEVWTTSYEDEKRPVEVTVLDNGPGIPDHELVPIREGRETDLEHGSGLGLWLVKWGVTTLDGQVTFEQNDPRGTTVTIQLPKPS